MLLGDGPLRGELNALVASSRLSGNVDMPGFVENPYVYMKPAALLASSSRWEGFVNVLIESLAVGTPVISTTYSSGPIEILDNGRYGRLTPVGDPDALADAMLATLDDPPNAERLFARARMFSPDNIIPQYLEILLGHSLETS